MKAAKLKPNLSLSREVRFKKPAGKDWQLGQKIDIHNFKIGDLINVTATNKGKGFAGNIKRHNFKSQPQSHGHKGNVRRSGSIGSLWPEKVFKGQKMPGRLGGRRTTIKNLKIDLIDDDHQVIGVLGAVPGPKKGLVMLKKVA